MLYIPYSLKHCISCDQNLPIVRFPKRGNICRDCVRRKHAEWAAQHPERTAEYKRRYSQNNKDKIRESNAKWRKAKQILAKIEAYFASLAP